MEAILKTSGVSCSVPAWSQTLYREEAQDCVVPDTLPDICEIVNTCGLPLIRSKDVGPGRVRLEANVPVKVTVQPEEGAPACLEVNLPFYFSAEDEAITDECVCTARLQLAALETRVLNPRKITVRAELAAELKCWKRGELTFCAAPEQSDAAIHALERSVAVSPVCAVTEKTFVLTDAFALPPGKAPAETVCGRSVSLHADDVKAVGSKLILKGSAVSSLLYRTVDGALETAEFSTQFSQIVEIDCEAEEAFSEVSLLLSGVYFDVPPVGDGRTINAELHLVAQAIIRKTAELSYLADAYSNAYALSLRRETRETTAIRRELLLRETVRMQSELPQPAAEISACTASVCELSARGAAASLAIRVTLFCRSAEGALFTAETLCRAELQADLREGEVLWPCGALIREPYAAAAGGGAELRLPVEVQAFAAQEQSFECISGISYDEANCRDLGAMPSLTLMRVSSDADLWTLARENCSTVEAIRSANDLASAVEPWERLLLIPKVV